MSYGVRDIRVFDSVAMVDADDHPEGGAMTAAEPLGVPGLPPFVC